jgi:ASC-1-like (ASCH) protein
MIHEMKLQPAPFDTIKAGTKKIECRLFDAKRQLIKVGDTIIFKRAPDFVEEVATVVTGLLRYSTFSALFADFAPEVFGVSDLKTLNEAIYQYYTKQDETTFGVVGIQIEL